MGSSPGFGSTACNSIALFRLAFATATLQSKLTSLHTSNSSAHYAKGTPSGDKRPPTACKHTVSGTISLSFLEYFSPFPHGTSSLSVTREYLALEGGPPRFPQDFTCPAVLGNTIQEVDCHFAYRTITFCGRTFQNASTMASICNFPASLYPCLTVPHNPVCTTRTGLNIQTVWAVSRSFATTEEIAVAFFS